MKIKNQTITGGSQQFANKIVNKNITADNVISTDEGYIDMSSHNNEIGDIAEGANVQQGVGDNATITNESKSEKQSILTNKFFLALTVLLIIIVLSIFSINSLCNNKILSDKSCRILMQEIIVRIMPIANSEDKK